MAQSQSRSWREAWTNIAVGYSTNFFLNLLIFNAVFNYNVSLRDNVLIGIIYTVVSLVRQYIIRRWFNKND